MVTLVHILILKKSQENCCYQQLQCWAQTWHNHIRYTAPIKKKAAQQHVSDESDGMSTGAQVQKNKLSPFPGTEGVDITQSDTRGVERVTF